ncbi:MAG: hypothetical protein VYB34_12255, partial [Planctomycetota bacterium]|nr:hypothetical protein [Planctomycetota bacterium]
MPARRFSLSILRHELNPANSLCESMGGGKERVGYSGRGSSVEGAGASCGTTSTLSDEPGAQRLRGAHIVNGKRAVSMARLGRKSIVLAALAS